MTNPGPFSAGEKDHPTPGQISQETAAKIEAERTAFNGRLHLRSLRIEPPEGVTLPPAVVKRIGLFNKALDATLRVLSDADDGLAGLPAGMLDEKMSAQDVFKRAIEFRFMRYDGLKKMVALLAERRALTAEMDGPVKARLEEVEAALQEEREKADASLAKAGLTKDSLPPHTPPNSANIQHGRLVDRCEPVAKLLAEKARLEAARRRLDEESSGARRDVGLWGDELAKAFKAVAGPLLI